MWIDRYWQRAPARRRRRRRPAKRQQRQQAQLLSASVGAAAALWLVGAAVSWLAAHWWVLVVLAILGVLAGVGLVQRRQQRAAWADARRRGLRYALDRLDESHHRDFEYAVRDLMRRDGCTDARQVGGAGDNGADVLATDPLGRRWVMQCKHRRAGADGMAVGTPDLQRLNGTARPLHRADVVVLVTNGRFSSKCPPLAGQLSIALVDRQTLATWAAGARPLWELLPTVPPPPGRPTLRP
ncbi:restriction endonuclease [Streptomyces sp. NPDC016845]|uniref:restriction endonuclease n=1 Tax=Streptomyces sp. NPDC016845 TaxID=3364972 RepID=UPI0037A69E5B